MMHTNVTAVSVAAWLCLSGAVAIAHHSVSVNFDGSKTLTLTGTVEDVDIRNPHSQITLDVRAPDGSVTEWFIEWSDKNALSRRRVPYERIRVGDTLTISATPHRHLEKVGYFRSAILPDKSILRDCGLGAFREAVANSEEFSCEPEPAR
jgi:hypothetical protein